MCEIVGCCMVCGEFGVVCFVDVLYVDYCDDVVE